MEFWFEIATFIHYMCTELSIREVTIEVRKYIFQILSHLYNLTYNQNILSFTSIYWLIQLSKLTISSDIPTSLFNLHVILLSNLNTSSEYLYFTLQPPPTDSSNFQNSPYHQNIPTSLFNLHVILLSNLNTSSEYLYFTLQPPSTDPSSSQTSPIHQNIPTLLFHLHLSNLTTSSEYIYFTLQPPHRPLSTDPSTSQISSSNCN